jgi:hypothetical protein
VKIHAVLQATNRVKPGIHVLLAANANDDVDGRVMCFARGHDER